MKKAFKFCLHLFVFFAIAGMVIAFGKMNAAAAPTALNCIDQPSANQSFYSSNVTLSGWALNSSGIQRIDVYLNGNFSTTVYESISRPDVASVYSGYNFPGVGTSGFSFTLSAGSLTPGTQKVDLAFIGSNGSVQWSTVRFNENKPGPAACIDTPHNNQTFYSADISLSGWALNASGISRADVYIDGSFKTSIATSISRPDVAQAYSSYNYPNAGNSGFSYIISNSSMSPGAHQARIAFIGNDGSVQWQSVNFNVSKPSPVSNIDTPSGGQNFNNSGVTLAGWALNASGISRTDVYVDGSFRTSVTSFSSRPDVAQVFSQYGYANIANSGFAYTIPSSSLSSGTHTANIAFIGNDGSVQWQSVKFTENIPPMVHSLDAPNSNQIFNNADVTFAGWALNASGISRIDLYLNGQFKTSITSFYNRTDVAIAYGGYNYANINNSGFNYVIPKDSIPAGSYQADLAFIGNDGNVQWSSVHFTENKAAPKICIDGPSNGKNINSTDNIAVYGWALNASSLSRVDLLLDGNYIGTDTQFSYHDGVNNIYNTNGDYENSNQNGYSFTVPMSTSLTLGTHVFLVAAYGKDGSVVMATTTIVSQNILITIPYNISFSDLFKSQSLYPTWNTDSYGSQVTLLTSYMNVSTLLNNPTDMYQFLDLEWHGGSVNAADLNNILVNKGSMSGQGQAFIDAANASHLNPIYLIAHARLETGNGTSPLATGTTSTNPGYFNMYGCHAYNSDPNGYGSDFAKANGWNTADKAIIGGAVWIAQSWVNPLEILGSPHYDQKTLYEMKWDPAGWIKNKSGFEYATDVSWAHSVAAIIKQYSSLFGNDRLTFNVPQYN